MTHRELSSSAPVCGRLKMSTALAALDAPITSEYAAGEKVQALDILLRSTDAAMCPGVHGRTELKKFVHTCSLKREGLHIQQTLAHVSRAKILHFDMFQTHHVASPYEACPGLENCRPRIGTSADAPGQWLFVHKPVLKPGTHCVAMLRVIPHEHHK